MIHLGVLAKRVLEGRGGKTLEPPKPQADVEVAL
jgi:hypothetical protein